MGMGALARSAPFPLNVITKEKLPLKEEPSSLKGLLKKFFLEGGYANAPTSCGIELGL